MLLFKVPVFSTGAVIRAPQILLLSLRHRSTDLPITRFRTADDARKILAARGYTITNDGDALMAVDEALLALRPLALVAQITRLGLDGKSTRIADLPEESRRPFLDALQRTYPTLSKREAEAQTVEVRVSFKARTEGSQTNQAWLDLPFSGWKRPPEAPPTSPDPVTEKSETKREFRIFATADDEDRVEEASSASTLNLLTRFAPLLSKLIKTRDAVEEAWLAKIAEQAEGVQKEQFGLKRGDRVPFDELSPEAREKLASRVPNGRSKDMASLRGSTVSVTKPRPFLVFRAPGGNLVLELDAITGPQGGNGPILP